MKELDKNLTLFYFRPLVILPDRAKITLVFQQNSSIFKLKPFAKLFYKATPSKLYENRQSFTFRREKQKDLTIVTSLNKGQNEKLSIFYAFIA